MGLKGTVWGGGAVGMRSGYGKVCKGTVVGVRG